MKLTEDERDMLQSLVAGWKNGDMPLSSGISYQMMFDWLASCGIDTKSLDDELTAKLQEYKKILGELGEKL